ncbi:glycosyltransferase [Gordonia soli]|uniref:glycosyltransferase n=1 Tax=Gordonia soli TaxID=320799 RepID=UPI001FE0ADF9|nr:glycosyltransferase [Gordonia soli]
MVPAHDESLVLPDCLAALARAVRRVDGPVDVVIVLDDCDEATAMAARAGVAAHGDTRWRVRHIDSRTVGAARAAGFAHAAWDDRTWFATTDADSRVGDDWLTTHLALAAAGADVVAGLVEPDDRQHWSTTMTELYEAHYRRVDGHGHVHGANLGFRASVYHRIGGFRSMALDEDVDLVSRASLSGAVVARTALAPVLTSVRESGRTAGGFAGFMRDLRQLADVTDGTDDTDVIAEQRTA